MEPPRSGRQFLRSVGCSQANDSADHLNVCDYFRRRMAPHGNRVLLSLLNSTPGLFFGPKLSYLWRWRRIRGFCPRTLEGSPHSRISLGDLIAAHS